jgi:hypothetical protein
MSAPIALAYMPEPSSPDLSGLQLPRCNNPVMLPRRQLQSLGEIAVRRGSRTSRFVVEKLKLRKQKAENRKAAAEIEDEDEGGV